jgi:rRNA-processing protein FCF1
MPHASTAIRIRRDLSAIVDGFSEIVRSLPVRCLEPQGTGIGFIAPAYYWGEPSPGQRAAQTKLKQQYEPISELLRLLVRQAAEDLVSQLEDADSKFRIWIELKDNWSLSQEPGSNENAFRSDAAAFDRILSVLDAMGNGDLLIVADTNSLLTSPDPTEYRSVAGQDTFTFMLLPTVLGELDRLKVAHRDTDVREKAKKVITRVKGWRQQGPLIDGITVDKSITVKARHNEPDMESTLSWLDATVADDRIVASVLQLQSEQPSARVVLVTGDINLQNKADAARIEVTELP